MPKKKLSNRMTPFQRKKLYAELARYKSGAPINDLAKRHGVSTGTVNHWWKKVKADRKRFVPAVNTTTITDPLARPDNGTLKVRFLGRPNLFDVRAPRIDIEALIRDEARKYLDEAFRKA